MRDWISEDTETFFNISERAGQRYELGTRDSNSSFPTLIIIQIMIIII